MQNQITTQEERLRLLEKKQQKDLEKRKEQLEKEISRLESAMYQHAQDLEFELAAEKRDQIDKLRKQFIANS